MIHAHDSAIVRTMSRLLIPLIQLFALYVLFFGQDGVVPPRVMSDKGV